MNTDIFTIEHADYYFTYDDNYILKNVKVRIDNSFTYCECDFRKTSDADVCSAIRLWKLLTESMRQVPDGLFKERVREARHKILANLLENGVSYHPNI